MSAPLPAPENLREPGAPVALPMAPEVARPARPRSDPWWPWRNIALAGALFIVAITALSVYEVVRGRREAIRETGHDLQTQGRVLAGQAVLSLQAVDAVLRRV